MDLAWNVMNWCMQCATAAAIRHLSGILKDLGRFGLGLKTASLSQCRKLTVISLKDGYLSAGCWDLDFVAQRNEWVLLVLSDHEAQAKPHVAELMEMGQGTLIIWEELDKLRAGYSKLGEKTGRAR